MEESRKDIQRYIDGIESQHRTAPRYMAFVTSLLEKIDPAHAVAKELPLAFYVYEAVGKQLDIVGRLIGVDRRLPPLNIPGQPSLLDDDNFRKVILAKIVQNQWNGTYEEFLELRKSTLDGFLEARYYDNQDMTMDIFIDWDVDPFMLQLLIHWQLFPKPMGVGTNVKLEVGTQAAIAYASTRVVGVSGATTAYARYNEEVL